jgi:hypothetical protein
MKGSPLSTGNSPLLRRSIRRHGKRYRILLGAAKGKSLFFEKEKDKKPFSGKKIKKAKAEEISYKLHPPARLHDSTPSSCRAPLGVAWQLPSNVGSATAWMQR